MTVVHVAGHVKQAPWNEPWGMCKDEHRPALLENGHTVSCC